MENVTCHFDWAQLRAWVEGPGPSVRFGARLHCTWNWAGGKFWIEILPITSLTISNLLAPESLGPGELEHPEAGSGSWLEEEEEEGSVWAVEEGGLAHLVGEHVQSILRPGLHVAGQASRQVFQLIFVWTQSQAWLAFSCKSMGKELGRERNFWNSSVLALQCANLTQIFRLLTFDPWTLWKVKRFPPRGWGVQII